MKEDTRFLRHYDQLDTLAKSAIPAEKARKAVKNYPTDERKEAYTMYIIDQTITEIRYMIELGYKEALVMFTDKSKGKTSCVCNPLHEHVLFEKDKFISFFQKLGYEVIEHESYDDYKQGRTPCNLAINPTVKKYYVSWE